MKKILLACFLLSVGSKNAFAEIRTANGENLTDVNIAFWENNQVVIFLATPFDFSDSSDYQRCKKQHFTQEKTKHNNILVYVRKNFRSLRFNKQKEPKLARN